MISRRSFLLGSVSAFALLPDQSANAGFLHHGGTSAAPTNSNTVLNFGGSSPTLFSSAFLNLAKWFQPSSSDVGWLGTLSGANGYPANGTVISSNWGSLMIWDPSYYGHYVLSWSGQATVANDPSTFPVIVYSGGATPGTTVFNISPSDSGTKGGNFAVQTASSSDTCSVEFAFGLLIGAVSSSGGLLEFTCLDSGFVGFLTTGQTVVMNNLTYNGAAFPAGPNFDGSWTVNVIDADHFTLQGSSALNSALVSINSSGTIGVNTEALIAGGDNIELAGTINNFSNWVLCKKSDVTAIASGQMATQTIVNALGASKASYLRFMDIIGVQDPQGISSFSDRTTPSSFTWGTFACPNNYWAGQLTNTSDAFTCSNPSGSPTSGTYLDAEVVVAQVGSAGQNTTQNPTLQITGRAGAVAAPIYWSSGGLLNLTLGGTPPAIGTVISGVFTGGGLASSHTLHYTANSADHADTSLQTLNDNIRNAVNADAALLAKNIGAGNTTVAGLGNTQSMGFSYNRNINSSGVAQLGAGMSISFSDNGSGTTYTTGLVSVGYLGNSNYVAFTFNALLGGWIATPYVANSMGGVRGGPPLEYLEELCTRANAGMWYNFGVTASSSVIFDTVQHVANSTVKSLVVEFSNETWNSGESSWGLCQSLAASLGLFSGGQNSLTGLRIIQMAQQATAAWEAAGRPRSQLKIACAYQFVDMNTSGTTPTAQFRFNGSELTPGSNVTLAAYGGPAGGTSSPTAWSTNSSVAPNRPVDWSDWVSPAPYWLGGQYNSGNGGSDIGGGVPLSAYNGSLLAAYNFAYGNSTQQQAALDFLYSTSTGNGDLYNGSFNGASFPSPDFQIGAWALASGTGGAGYFGVGTAVASYDSSRSTIGTSGGAQVKLGVGCYEGGWCMGPIVGTGDPAQVANDLTSLGYTNGYSSSLPGAASGPVGAGDTASIAAINLAKLLVAWKFDARAFTLCSLQYQQFKASVNTVSTRDAFPCHYGFEGPGDFAVYPGLPTQSLPFQVIPALAAYQ